MDPLNTASSVRKGQEDRRDALSRREEGSIVRNWNWRPFLLMVASEKKSIESHRYVFGLHLFVSELLHGILFSLRVKEQERCWH